MAFSSCIKISIQGTQICTLLDGSPCPFAHIFSSDLHNNPVRVAGQALPTLDSRCTAASKINSRSSHDMTGRVYTFKKGIAESVSVTLKKAECRKIDVFELWCWRRLLRVPWTARRSNQSILKEISPGYSLEGLLLKLKLLYFGHLMRRTDSFEKS